MKKGLIFLLLIMSFGVFGAGKVNAETTIEKLNRQIGTAEGNYTSCIEKYKKNLGDNCDTQINGLVDANKALADYKGISTSLSETIVVAQNNYTTCMKTNNDDVSKCQEQLTLLENTKTVIDTTEGNNGPSDQTVNTAKQLDQQLSTAKIKLTNCQVKNAENQSVCADQLEAFNSALSAVTTFEQQSGYVLDNAQKTSPTITPISADDIKNCEFGLASAVGVAGTFSVTKCASVFITWFIKTTLINYSKIFLFISAQAMNKAITYTIFDSDNSVAGVIRDLYPSWQAMRNIVDFWVFFLMLYLGALYIANVEAGKQFIEKHIPWLILFALFVNFSYPATKALIDVSNVISLKIYASTVGAQTLEGGIDAGANIMSRLGFPSLIGTVTSEKGAGDLVQNIDSPVPAFMVFIEIMFASFIFIFIALIMIMRSIILIFIVVVSPLLLINKVVPWLGEPAAKIRTEFFNMLALPVVFTLMFFLTTQIITSITLKPATGNNTTIVQMFNVAIMLISLYMMAKVTKSVSGSFGKAVEGFAGKAAGLAMMATPAMAARATLGRLGAGMTNSNTAIGGWIDKNRGTVMGDAFHKLGGGLRDSTYDMRNAKGAGMLAGMGGVEMGKGSDSTYQKNLELRQKDFSDKYNNISNEQAKDRFADNYTGNNKGIVGKALSFGRNGTNIAMPTMKEEGDKMNAKIDKERKILKTYDSLEGERKQAYFDTQNKDIQQILVDKNIEQSEKEKQFYDVQGQKDHMEEAQKENYIKQRAYDAGVPHMDEANKMNKAYKEGSDHIDEARAEEKKQDKTRATYGNFNGQTDERRKHFESRNEQDKDILMSKDHTEAEKENKTFSEKRDQEESMIEEAEKENKTFSEKRDQERLTMEEAENRKQERDNKDSTPLDFHSVLDGKAA